MSLRTETTGPASLILRDGGEQVCEIRDLCLAGARFRPGGEPLIGSRHPLPLYWEQYAHHEDPERNAGNHPSLRIIRQSPDEIEIGCFGSTFSRQVESSYLLAVTRKEAPVRYEYTIRASMKVSGSGRWRVTPNPSQGELEYCNLWPEGIFSERAGTPLRYQGTYLCRGERVIRIPHHHLETPDKENIPLLPDDRIAWLLEGENLLLTLLDVSPTTAAVCAYMWDLHLAYRVCHERAAVDLPPSFLTRAAFRLSSLTASDAQPIVDAAIELPVAGLERMPVVINGVSLYGDAITSGETSLSDIWPWEKEISRGDPATILFTVEPAGEPGGSPALCISTEEGGVAAWKASALGPAYRQAPFSNGARHRLSARIACAQESGEARLSIRIHRTGSPGLSDPSTYELVSSTGCGRDWSDLVVETGPISPPPDRIHLLLEWSGGGRCRFTNIQYSTSP